MASWRSISSIYSLRVSVHGWNLGETLYILYVIYYILYILYFINYILYYYLELSLPASHIVALSISCYPVYLVQIRQIWGENDLDATLHSSYIHPSYISTLFLSLHPTYVVQIRQFGVKKDLQLSLHPSRIVALSLS